MTKPNRLTDTQPKMPVGPKGMKPLARTMDEYREAHPERQPRLIPDESDDWVSFQSTHADLADKEIWVHKTQGENGEVFVDEIAILRSRRSHTPARKLTAAALHSVKLGTILDLIRRREAEFSDFILDLVQDMKDPETFERFVGIAVGASTRAGSNPDIGYLRLIAIVYLKEATDPGSHRARKRSLDYLREFHDPNLTESKLIRLLGKCRKFGLLPEPEAGRASTQPGPVLKTWLDRRQQGIEEITGQEALT